MSANAEIIATLRQAMSDWNKATQAQRDEALRLASARANTAERRTLSAAAHMKAGARHV